MQLNLYIVLSADWNGIWATERNPFLARPKSATPKMVFGTCLEYFYFIGGYFVTCIIGVFRYVHYSN